MPVAQYCAAKGCVHTVLCGSSCPSLIDARLLCVTSVPASGASNHDTIYVSMCVCVCVCLLLLHGNDLSQALTVIGGLMMLVILGPGSVSFDGEEKKMR